MAERPEDLSLPTAVISRIIKDAVPEGVNVSKDARLAISKAASVFILYATSCANNFAMKANRKTMNAQDIMNGMDEMEFGRFIEPLKQCLEAYRKQQKGKKEASEQRKKAKEQTETSGGGSEETGEVIEVDDDSVEEAGDDEDDEDDNGDDNENGEDEAS